jgi:hypothetical protein
MNPRFAVCVLSFVTFASLSCTSITGIVGKALEGDYSRSKTIDKYSYTGANGAKIRARVLKSRKDGTETLSLQSSAYPAITVICSVPGAGGSLRAEEVRFIAAELLASHRFGWNQVRFELSGPARFSPVIGRVGLRFGAPPQVGEVISGMIRLRDDRLEGESALNALRARAARLQDLVGWMRNYPPAKGRKQERNPERDIEQFEKFWYTILFREKRYTVSEAGTAVDVYSLRRDWDEALVWIYYDYYQDAILRSFEVKSR